MLQEWRAPMRPPLDPYQQLGYLLVRAADQISRAWLAALRRHGLNPRQFSALAILAREPGLSQAELARRVMITPQSMSESIAALIDGGFLRRKESAPGRIAALELTSAAKALLARAYPVVEGAEREAFATLTGGEREALGTVLRKLLGDAP